MSRGRPILTASQMRAAEQAAISAGTPAERLMERAGAGLAEAAYRFAGPLETLILCGPGNNGGDGYVAARYLAERGVDVRVATLAGPSTAAAAWARSQWSGHVEPFQSAAPRELLVDCLFGTGLTRGLEVSVSTHLNTLAKAARIAIACDLPSGADSDTGACLSAVPSFHMTVTFGALKPSHRLMPAMQHMGRVVLVDIGIAAKTRSHEITRPNLPPFDPEGHKFDRGMVAIQAGAMPGAAALAATAAARTGAGYVRLIAERAITNVPAAVAQNQSGRLDDPRIGALLVGPGLGGTGNHLLESALASGRPLVLDADALNLLDDPARLRGFDAIITPHAGEFARLFGPMPGSKAEQTMEAARRSGAVVVVKGPDTLVASPDGDLGFAPPAPTWLASAGTGDVLAGMIAALRARGMRAFDAASAGVWLHGRAAEAAGPGMIADDLAAAIPAVL